MQPAGITVSVPSPRGTFRERITSGRFCYGAELVTTRGYVAHNTPSQIVELGKKLCADPRIDWVSITDNPGGNAMLPPDWLARMLRDKPTPLVIHLTCKDQNRNGLESAAWRYASEGFENIAAMTGDYPRGGFGGNAAPVFDLDSVSLIALLQAMNEGLRVAGKKGDAVLPKTNFYIGCVVSPFKRHERELMPQYFKLLRKIAAGARFVYTQVGYDLRKSHEVKLVLESNGIGAPVIGTAYVLTKTVAEMFHRNQVAGCVVTDQLMQLVNKYSAGPDRGRSFFIELAAKQLAAFKGLGLAGGYIGGVSTAETFFEIIERAKSFGADDWKQFVKEIQFSQPDEFYLFERDAKTGLGKPDEINPRYLESLSMPPKTRNVTAGFRLARFIHRKVFTPDTAGFRAMKRLYEKLDAKDGALERAAHSLEKLSKFVWFGCKDCGDCALPETGYLCPLVACSKGARNGPCGGSADGECEMLDKECIWARAYERMKFYGESREMLEGPPVFYNAHLKGTSSWANAFLGRDHHAVNPQQEHPAPHSSFVRGSSTPLKNPTDGLPKDSRGDLRSNESAGSGDHCCKHLDRSMGFSQRPLESSVVGRECPDEGGVSRRQFGSDCGENDGRRRETQPDADDGLGIRALQGQVKDVYSSGSGDPCTTDEKKENKKSMPIKGLSIIGESINDSVPSTKALFDANNLDGIVALAKSQDEKGAAYIDVNVGRRSPELMAETVRRIQTVTAKPLSIDTPDVTLAEAGLRAYDKSRAGGALPILNSISPLRLQMFDLYKIQPFMPILLISERLENGAALPNQTAEQTFATAREMLCAARQRGIPNSQLIFDPGIAPIGADSEGNLKRLLAALQMMHDGRDFAGVHISVGLSNFTQMLPPKRADGSPVKSPLESAFLTLAMPLGLDMVIGSVARKYELLPDHHPALQCLRDCLKLDGFDSILRVQEFYSS